jgi:hypothetical protein
LQQISALCAADAELLVQSTPMESFEQQALWMEQVLAELVPQEHTLSATPSEVRPQRRTRIAFPTTWSLCRLFTDEGVGTLRVGAVMGAEVFQ